MHFQRSIAQNVGTVYHFSGFYFHSCNSNLFNWMSFGLIQWKIASLLGAIITTAHIVFVMEKLIMKTREDYFYTQYDKYYISFHINK